MDTHEMDTHDKREGVRPPASTAAWSDLSGDAWGLQALAFLERSREVADEGIVDVARDATSTSGHEAPARPRSLPSV
jgi:hypothetical protein